MPLPDAFADDVRAALASLGVDRLVLQIHQTSFPAGDGDIGCGTPYSDAGAAFLSFARGLGFTGVALGPGGVTARDDPSPYDATWSGLNPMFLDAGALPPGVRGDAAGDATARARDADGRDPGGVERVDVVRAWDASRALAAALERSGGDVQQVLRSQHARMRARAHGLRVYADAHIGVSYAERLQDAALFLPGYAMGAPPSRTNPDGQPWGYPVLDPRALDEGGAARAFVERRFDALFAMHDGVRIDHPHGWVCPWVYRTDVDDALFAVQHGARLYESPDLPDHPALAAFARVTPAQIDRARPRYDDRWVRALDQAQIDRYAAILDVILARAAAHGVDGAGLMVEVLSTCPRPLLAVLERFGLGRFRVTQKAKVEDPHDVYRSDNAEPADWILVGNHDTPPLRLVVERWDDAERARRAAWLTFRLAARGASAADRDAMRARLAGGGAPLFDAMLAELFAGPANNVAVFWVDLFGLTEIYNRPGVVHADNWTLRVPRDFARAFDDAVAAGRAPHLGRALALALRARGLDGALAARLAR